MSAQTRCGTCGWDMRPPKTNLIDRPNTRTYAGPGICTACRAHATTPAPDFDLNTAAMALRGWLQDRRRRGVPADGYQI